MTKKCVFFSPLSYAWQANSADSFCMLSKPNKKTFLFPWDLLWGREGLKCIGLPNCPSIRVIDFSDARPTQLPSSASAGSQTCSCIYLTFPLLSVFKCLLKSTVWVRHNHSRSSNPVAFIGFGWTPDKRLVAAFGLTFPHCPFSNRLHEKRHICSHSRLSNPIAFRLAGSETSDL